MAWDADRRSEARSPSVLRGDRQPLWGCQCGAQGNWACRIKCRCGRSAPDKFVQKAKRSHAEWAKGRAAAIEQPERRAASRTRAPPAKSEERKEIEKLRKEVQKLQLRAQAAPQPPPDDEDMELEQDDGGPEVDLDALVKLAQSTESLLGADSSAYKELAAKLEMRRRKRDQNKPLDKQVRDLEAKQKRKQAQVQAAKAAVENAKKAVEEAAEELAAAEKAATAKIAEEDELKAQLLALHQKQVEQASSQREPVQLGEKARSLLAELGQVLGPVPATQALLVPVLQAVNQFEAAAGQQAGAPAASGEDDAAAAAGVQLDADEQAKLFEMLSGAGVGAAKPEQATEENHAEDDTAPSEQARQEVANRPTEVHSAAQARRVRVQPSG